MTTEWLNLSIPYGSGYETALINPKRTVHILTPTANHLSVESEKGPLGNSPSDISQKEKSIILKALRNPIGSPGLQELARDKKKVVIVTSDHTRPVPSHLTIPLMISEIRAASPVAHITILIGVGCHRNSTKEEMLKKFGPDVVNNEVVINHDPLDEANLVSLGRLPSGGELRLNRLALEADLLVADGFIEPHQFAGFSGGRKSILPGIAAFNTVLASHNSEFTVHPLARPGSLDGNPFQEDMVYAARKANLAFILNVTLTPDKRVSMAFAGDLLEAHLKGCEYVLAESAVQARPSPIVITSNGGYPLDQNIYQSTKSIMAADLTCQDNGVIIAVNECRDGHGSESFLNSFKNASSLSALLSEIESRSREETIPDQWVIQLTASILIRRKVIMVTKAAQDDVTALGMRKQTSLEAALKQADELTGNPLGPITVLPNAVAVVIRP
ncbi:MAG: nickel-dependent lactate racemase [Deltaproteobacteria bacterium]|jgi:nickel-dependent lactate racemase|nr:nickel-dependent lactate racemase [Deltaproteobacteria bacterium]